MDPKTQLDINQCKNLLDYVAQTCEVISRTRLGQNGAMGLHHTGFSPSIFGLPVQGMPVVDPRGVEFNGFMHSPYGVYPSYYGPQSFGGWTNPQVGGLPTAINPFYGQSGITGLTHSSPWGWSPYAAAELARQREIFARQQYEAAMWRSPFGTGT